MSLGELLRLMLYRTNLFKKMGKIDRLLVYVSIALIKIYPETF